MLDWYFGNFKHWKTFWKKIFLYIYFFYLLQQTSNFFTYCLFFTYFVSSQSFQMTLKDKIIIIPCIPHGTSSQIKTRKQCMNKWHDIIRPTMKQLDWTTEKHKACSHYFLSFGWLDFLVSCVYIGASELRSWCCVTFLWGQHDHYLYLWNYIPRHSGLKMIKRL